MNSQTLLAILQQSEYDLKYFERWYRDHGHEIASVEPERWTAKLQVIGFLYKGLFFLPVLWRLRLILGLLKPWENLLRWIIYSLAGWKLLVLRWLGLKVVAIAGSYGKTSTKHILYHGLKPQLSCYMTPKSINTKLGIARVILSGLKLGHRLFLVELGEFAPRDMVMFGKFLKPDYAVLTPIGRQHLERFGSLEQIVANFASLVKFFSKQPERLLVAEGNQPFFKSVTPLLTYGQTDHSLVRYRQPRVSRAGTEYEVIVNNLAPQPIFIPLYGQHQALNSLPLFWLAEKLGLDLNRVGRALRALPFIAHRHQPTFAEHDVLILDNGYNSNPDSVTASLQLLNQLHPTHRLVITPGFVELGEESDSIHFKFGQQLARAADFVGLIAAPHTDRIAEGFYKAGGKKGHLFTAQTQEELVGLLRDKIIPGSVILFENGVNQVYL